MHPTQKPEALLARVILSSTKPGDTILDPFFGTGTTGAVAKRLGGISWASSARTAISRRRPSAFWRSSLCRRTRWRPMAASGPSRACPLRRFDMGLVQPGTMLSCARGRHRAYVQADGTIRAEGAEPASIHKIGARVQGLDACNGWTFWHVVDGASLKPIDALRQIVRDAIARPGSSETARRPGPPRRPCASASAIRRHSDRRPVPTSLRRSARLRSSPARLPASGRNG